MNALPLKGGPVTIQERNYHSNSHPADITNCTFDINGYVQSGYMHILNLLLQKSEVTLANLNFFFKIHSLLRKRRSASAYLIWQIWTRSKNILEHSSSILLASHKQALERWRQMTWITVTYSHWAQMLLPAPGIERWGVVDRAYQEIRQAGCTSSKEAGLLHAVLTPRCVAQSIVPQALLKSA